MRLLTLSGIARSEPAGDHDFPMAFFAHTENSDGKRHKLADHLRGVGERAAEFAAQMNPECVDSARWAGLLHDFENEL